MAPAPQAAECRSPGNGVGTGAGLVVYPRPNRMMSRMLRRNGEFDRVRGKFSASVRHRVSLSTEAVDNSVDFSTGRSAKSGPHCTFITLVKK